MKDKQAKYPQLRFKGFTDPWEQRKLGELGKIYTGNTPKTSDLDNWTDNKEGHIWITPTDIDKLIMSDSDRHLSEQGWSKARKIPENSVLITSIASIGKNTINAVPVAFNQQINAIVPEKNDSYFILSAMIKDTARFASVAGQTATAIINKTTFEKFQIATPSYEEQQKIGSFFKQLDQTITLHQRKLDLLKEQKKGYLQKLFPKNGSKFPQLRFAGFADDWEERKLSDVANHRGGTAIEKYFDKDGVYKVISIGSYGLNSQYVDQNIRAISNEITDGRVVNSGELTMVLNDKTANGTIIGRTLLVEKDNEYVINQRTEIISPKENFDSNFAYTILNGPFREKVKRIVQGGTQIYVNYPAVSNLNLELPKIEEQQKIGSFFKQLDDTIALHQRKLDLLKEQKKGFLQKMFV
ncbi:restriction endonuclease subunit S [Loigolactobacillus backii]|uniref:restriction endonuclease subunit S n=1 Tax=Loigolactobacillus backii TaxID=375175 RepID=UPI0007F0D8A9|nr:restriction endonuclease subunit S [Loigolactobacillus backii]ANK68598.1 restriction endonuclease subunit S [Loigolactobacillus backii]OLF69007.1 restriction endonuclease subunit S [Loigolactobacillus backii]PIO88499.1 restriction endonuclease subunit S [Loigolactobacillus backii]